MRLKKALLLFFIIPILSFTTIHKYYLSLTQIEFVKEKEAVQIILRVFMDDIELAINKKNNIDAKLTTKQELKNVDQYFKKYLQENFKIKIDDTSKNFNFIGKEYEGDIVYFYLEVPEIQAVSKLEISNTILTDYFPDQQNLIKAKVNGKHRSKMLTKKNDKGLLKF